ISKIVQAVGMKADMTDPRVTIVQQQNDERLSAEIASQTYSNVVGITEAAHGSLPDGLSEHSDILVYMAPEFEYASTHVEDLVNAFRYTGSRAVQKIEKDVHGKLESSRHTYMELTNLSALGAEYIGKIPDDVDVERGYDIDEV